MILEHWIIAEISAVHRRRFQRVDTRRKAFSEIYKVRSIEEEQAGITTEISVIEVIRTSNKIAKFWVLRKFAEICEICEFEFCENLRKCPQKHTKRLRARCHIPRLAWSWETSWETTRSEHFFVIYSTAPRLQVRKIVQNNFLRKLRLQHTQRTAQKFV